MRLFALSALVLSTTLQAQTAPDWVTRSNINAQLLNEIDAKHSPESAAGNGQQGVDDKISILGEAESESERADTRAVRAKLQSRLATEKDPLVKQDLEILVAAADLRLQQSEVAKKYFLPYVNAGGAIFYGEKQLLDDQIAPARRPAALARLKKYTGMEPGYKPLTLVAEEWFREREKVPGLIGPSKDEVEKDLGNTSAYITGIGLLLEKYNISGYQPAFAKLKDQLTEYDAFIRREVLPKARTDFRQPPEYYAVELKQYGVDYTPDELVRLAHASFTDIQSQMQTLAAKIAKQRGLPSSTTAPSSPPSRRSRSPAMRSCPTTRRGWPKSKRSCAPTTW